MPDLNKPAIEEVSGYVGVGALQILGGFLILDGLAGFLNFIELYSKTSAWAIFVTVPMLVVSYLLGLFSCIGTQVIYCRILRAKMTPELFALITNLKNDLLTQKYLDTERHVRLLFGCSCAFTTIAIGSYFEVNNMGVFRFVGYLGSAGGFLISIMCPILARHLQEQLLPFVDAVRALPPPAESPASSNQAGHT